MPFLQNMLSDYFQKAQQGRLTMGSPIAKRVKQVSSLRPWFIHTLRVRQVSACWFLLFLERVSVRHTALFPLSSLPSLWCGHSSLLVACTSALDFFSTFHSVFLFPFHTVKELDFFPPILLREGFCKVLGTAACNPAARSCYFMPVLFDAWHTLNLEEYDIRAHLSFPLH